MKLLIYFVATTYFAKSHIASQRNKGSSPASLAFPKSVATISLPLEILIAHSKRIGYKETLITKKLSPNLAGTGELFQTYSRILFLRRVPFLLVS